MNKKYILSAGIVFVSVLLIVGGYFAYTYYTQSKDDDIKPNDQAVTEYEKTEDPNVVEIKAAEEDLVEVETSPTTEDSETIKVPSATTPPPPPTN